MHILTHPSPRSPLDSGFWILPKRFSQHNRDGGVDFEIWILLRRLKIRLSPEQNFGGPKVCLHAGPKICPRRLQFCAVNELGASRIPE